MGGVISQVPESAMAAGSRDTKYNLLIIGMWQHAEQDQLCKDWVRGFAKAAAPFSTGRTYTNYLDAEEALATQGRDSAIWGTEKYRRLVNLKKEHDPFNLFRLNQNIASSAEITGA